MTTTRWQTEGGVCRFSIGAIMKLGEQLKAARLAAGMTQRQLAFAIRSEQATVSKWELGKITPTTKTVKKLLAALGIK